MTSNSISGAQVRKRSSTPAICPSHPGNKAAFICTRPECDGSFICMTCVNINHKGHKLEDLVDYAASKKQILNNKVKTGKDNILTLLLRNIKSTEQKITENKTKTKNDQDNIIQRCNELKANLDKICQKYTELRKNTGDESDRKLTKHKECLETLYTEYKTKLKECETAIDEGSDSDIVLAEREFPAAPKPPNPPITDDLHFVFNSISNKELEVWFGELLSVKYTGVIKPTTIPISVQGAIALPSENIQQITHFALRRNTTFGCSYIYSSPDQLYVWFYESRTISVVNKEGQVTNRLSLLPGLDKSYHIDGVCVSPADGTLWSVCDDDSRVQQVTPDGTLLKSFTQKHAMSVCVTRNQSILVGAGAYDDVNIFTTSGKRKRTLTYRDTGLSDCPFYVVQCQMTGRVAITDYKAISVLDDKYRHLYTIHGEIVTTADNKTKSTGYKPKEEFNPFSMCFDKDGDLLVSDDVNYNVIIFNSSGQYIRTIVQEIDENKRPRVVNTAPDGTLWVAYENDVFKQIKYK